MQTRRLAKVEGRPSRRTRPHKTSFQLTILCLLDPHRRVQPLLHRMGIGSSSWRPWWRTIRWSSRTMPRSSSWTKMLGMAAWNFAKPRIYWIGNGKHMASFSDSERHWQTSMPNSNDSENVWRNNSSVSKTKYEEDVKSLEQAIAEAETHLQSIENETEDAKDETMEGDNGPDLEALLQMGDDKLGAQVISLDKELQAVEERDRGNEDYVQFADRPAPALHAAGGEAPSRIGSQGSSGLTSPCPWFASQFAVAATGEDTQSSQRRSSCGIRWTTQTSKDDRCSEGRDGYTDYRGQPHRAGQEGEHEQEPQCHGLNHGSLMLAEIIAPAHGWCFQGDGELWLTSSPFSALQGCVQDGVQLGPFVDGMENYVKEISMNSLVDCSGPRSPHESGLVQDVGCDINSPRRVEWIVYRSQIPLASSRFLVDMHSCGVAFQEAYGRCWYSLCLKGLLAEQPYGEGLHDRFHLMKTPRINPTIDDRWKNILAHYMDWPQRGSFDVWPSSTLWTLPIQTLSTSRWTSVFYPYQTTHQLQTTTSCNCLVAFTAFQSMHCQLFNRRHGPPDDLNQNLGREDTASKTRLRTCLLSGYPGSYTQRFLTADSGYDNLDRQLPYYAWTSTTTGTSMRTSLLPGYPGQFTHGGPIDPVNLGYLTQLRLVTLSETRDVPMIWTTTGILTKLNPASLGYAVVSWMIGTVQRVFQNWTAMGKEDMDKMQRTLHMVLIFILQKRRVSVHSLTIGLTAHHKAFIWSCMDCINEV